MKELSLHILDIVQNSIRANANLIRIEIDEKVDENELVITITDNGTGMNQATLEQASDPFYTSRTTRKVGLGLSLFKQNAEMTGGSLKIDSKSGSGTSVKTIFGLNHPDRPILGDLTGTLILLICSPEEINYVFKHHTPHGMYEFDTQEFRQTLENVPLTHPDVRAFLREMLLGNLEQIQISE